MTIVIQCQYSSWIINPQLDVNLWSEPMGIPKHSLTTTALLAQPTQSQYGQTGPTEVRRTTMEVRRTHGGRPDSDDDTVNPKVVYEFEACSYHGNCSK